MRLILDGFFPACAPGETPRRAARTALQELGLPYAQDPAITRHLAAFLRQHAAACFSALHEEPRRDALPRPDAILFNGGVFNSPQISQRLIEVVSSWWPDAPPHSACCRTSRWNWPWLAARPAMVWPGAAWDGASAADRRTHFMSGWPLKRKLPRARAICLIPRGHEEGQPVDLKSRPFELMLGRPVQFPLFSTTSDRIDRPGDIVEIGDEFRALPPIHTLFKGAGAKTTTVPVHLRATLTELGTLELWCVSNDGDERWRLEFELRGATARRRGHGDRIHAGAV